MNEQFNIEQMWLKYLNLTGQKLHEMHPQQLIETKRAYIGGLGQMAVALTQDLLEVSDEEACAITDGIFEQISAFWQSQK